MKNNTLIFTLITQPYHAINQIKINVLFIIKIKSQSFNIKYQTPKQTIFVLIILPSKRHTSFLAIFICYDEK